MLGCHRLSRASLRESPAWPADHGPCHHSHSAGYRRWDTPADSAAAIVSEGTKPYDQTGSHCYLHLSDCICSEINVLSEPAHAQSALLQSSPEALASAVGLLRIEPTHLPGTHRLLSRCQTASRSLSIPFTPRFPEWTPPSRHPACRHLCQLPRFLPCSPSAALPAATAVVSLPPYQCRPISVEPVRVLQLSAALY